MVKTNSTKRQVAKGYKCKECKEYLRPDFMLWNGVCVFCWFGPKKYRGKEKKDAIVMEE